MAGDGRGERIGTRPGGGPQRRRMKAHEYPEWRWDLFLDELATTVNVTFAAGAAGVSLRHVYRRWAADAGFAHRWDGAVEQGCAHLQALLVKRAARGAGPNEPGDTAADALEAADPGQMDPDLSIRLLAMYKARTAEPKP